MGPEGISIVGFQFLTFAQKHPDELLRNSAEVDSLLAAREALPHIGAVIRLDEVVAALGLVAQGGAVGKVVLEVAPETHL